jgi:hypothetical protein
MSERYGAFSLNVADSSPVPESVAESASINLFGPPPIFSASIGIDVDVAGGNGGALVETATNPWSSAPVSVSVGAIQNALPTGAVCDPSAARSAR